MLTYPLIPQLIRTFPLQKRSAMTTKEIAKKLAGYCAKGQWEHAQKELYAEHATSTEQHASPDFEKETKGLKAIIEKGHKFNKMVEEMHSVAVSEPVVADNSFAIVMTMDSTMKGRGRMKMSELCVYQVKDGKVVAEQFFM